MFQAFSSKLRINLKAVNINSFKMQKLDLLKHMLLLLVFLHLLSRRAT